MKRFIQIILVLATICCLAPSVKAAPSKGGKTTIRVASLGLTESGERRRIIMTGKVSPQRFWSLSADAVAEMIVDIDCDVIALQEICDSIAGRVGERSLAAAMAQQSDDYEIYIPSNINPNYPDLGKCANANGVMWKKSKFECVDKGIWWISGIYDKPGRDKSLKYGDTRRSFAWVRLRSVDDGREFYVLSTGFSGPSYRDENGKDVKYPEINTANAANTVALYRSMLQAKGVPSIFCANIRSAENSEGYTQYLSSQWFDVFGTLRDDGLLDEDTLKKLDTMNTPDETKLTSGRPDHIMVDGFRVNNYRVHRAKYQTADGSKHYPCQHFPIIAELNF